MSSIKTLSPVLLCGGGLGKYAAFVDFLILSYLCKLIIRQTVWYDCHNFQKFLTKDGNDQWLEKLTEN